MKIILNIEINLTSQEERYNKYKHMMFIFFNLYIIITKLLIKTF